MIEISIKHVILSFGGLLLGAALVGSSVVLMKDYVKYHRQKTIIDAAAKLFREFQDPERRANWKNEKRTTATQSTSPTKT